MKIGFIAIRVVTVALVVFGFATRSLAEPTNGPLVALGFTNTPIGEATTLEVIDYGVLFVGNTADGDGVSVQLGEADSGIFLFPLTGYLYEGDVLEGKAFGSLNAVTNQFISSVRGVHVGGSAVEVTADFSALGATRLSVFLGARLLGQISNSVATVRVQGPGYGCRANPWWRLPDGSYGALVELDGEGSWSIAPLTDESSEETIGSSCLFVRPDDPTNSVEFISHVEVTSTGLGSFCLTDARLGMFHQRHKALGQAMLVPAGGQLVVGNLVSNLQDGIFVELPNVSGFDVDFVPIELVGTNAALLISGTVPGTTRIDNANGFLQIVAEMGSPTEMVVRSNGVVVGSATVSSNVTTVNLSDGARIAGYGIITKTMERPASVAVRVDRATTFTVPDGQGFVGDEVRIIGGESAFLESIASFVLLVNEVPSFTITDERVSSTSSPVPELNIARSTNAVTLSWPDPNRIYHVEVSTTISDGFSAIPDEPAFANNRCQVTLPTEGECRFFRLQRYAPNSD